MSKGWDSNSLETHRLAWAQQLGLRMSSRPVSPKDAASPHFQTLTPREQDVLAYNQAICAGKGDIDSLAQAAVCDVNNSITHPGVGHWVLGHGHVGTGTVGRLVAPTILPQGKMWVSIEAESKLRMEPGEAIHRIICGTEALELIGWPVMVSRFTALVNDTSQVLLHNLGGNAFVPTVIAPLVAG